ncbi:hypothetical protein ACFO0N_11385 [Halobium salinum]|uniref:Uncharacterized protein n=1 Tax=Halobium salinum TaxID=1364940 RepID=A0ABD5PCU5_9EURY|nr:hypothetical protein [Halobium salinum]
MSRTAVERGIERYVDDLIDVAADEFSVAAALRGGVRGPGGAVVDRLLGREGALRRHVVRPELDATRRDVLDGFAVVLDVAESDDSVSDRADDLLAHDGFYDALREDLARERREAARERLLERHRRLVEAARPPVESPEDEFWPAVRDSLDADAARSLLETALSFTDPVVADREAFAFVASFDPGEVLQLGPLGRGVPTVTVEYTDEAIRTMRRAETVVTRRATREARRQFETV